MILIAIALSFDRLKKYNLNVRLILFGKVIKTRPLHYKEGNGGIA